MCDRSPYGEGQAATTMTGRNEPQWAEGQHAGFVQHPALFILVCGRQAPKTPGVHKRQAGIGSGSLQQ